MNEPEWLTKEAVLYMHREVVDASGGSQGIRDEGLLESALSRPQNVFAYEDVTIFDLAASYAEAIAHNHPFIDGNKRTAMTAADVFLEINGYEMHADQQKLADLMVNFAEKKISRDEVAIFFKKNCD
jgi:death-on-curing protein